MPRPVRCPLHLRRGAGVSPVTVFGSLLPLSVQRGRRRSCGVPAEEAAPGRPGARPALCLDLLRALSSRHRMRDASSAAADLVNGVCAVHAV